MTQRTRSGLLVDGNLQVVLRFADGVPVAGELRSLLIYKESIRPGRVHLFGRGFEFVRKDDRSQVVFPENPRGEVVAFEVTAINCARFSVVK